MSSSALQNRPGKSSIFTANTNHRFAGPRCQTLSPLIRNFAGAAARLWESSEASTERSPGEGSWCRHP
jgi:hypothetical protein